MRKFFGLATALLLLLALPAAAQETSGSITGTITDSSGSSLPGVTVVATADGKAATVYTDGRGHFRFPALTPGDYELVASLTDFTSQKVTGVDLNLGEVLTINLTMDLAEVSETIVVTSEAPVIEITQSATATSVSGELIESLPRGRNFTSVVTQATHAVDERDAGGIAIDGSSGGENRFVVDGIDTTNLQTGVSAKNVITDHVQEVQIKSSGYNAEYGGSTGGVINVITKTGSNDWRGDITGYYSSSDLYGDREATLRRNPDTGDAEYIVHETDDWERIEPGLTLSGPVLKDRMWFFASYIPQNEDLDRTIDYGGSVGVLTYPRSTDFDYGTANLSGTIGNSVSYKVAYNISDRERIGVSLPSQNATSDPFGNYSVGRINPNESYSGHLDWLVNQKVALSFRGGNFLYDEQDVGAPSDIWWGFSTGSAGAPGELYPEMPAEFQGPLGMASVNNLGTAFDEFTRDTVEGDLTYYASDFGGDHTFKLGAQMAQIGNKTLSGYQNTRILFYWGSSRVDLFGESRTGTYGHYRLLQIATQGDVSSDNLGIFLQDSWRPTDRLTLNLGVRAESEEVPSYATTPGIPETAIDLDFGDKLAPRLGFAYDIKGDGTWKAYGSYGVFYDITKLEMPRGSFGGDKWIDHFYGLETFDWPSIVADAGCRIGASNSISEVPTCPGEHLFSIDRRHPSNDPNDSTIDPNIKPMESNEITLGVEHQLSRRMSVGARYVHKELERTIEDVGVQVPGVGEVFFIANPGEGIAKSILGPDFPDQPKARRDYDGLELDFRLRATKNWTVHASYLYSRLYGNYSGLASSDEAGRNSPNVNRFFDGLPMNFDASGSGQPVYGRLGTDRPHQFKAQVIYRTKWETSFGWNQYVASGTPKSTRMDVAPSLPFFPYGRGDLGRTPTFTQSDLYIEHPFKLGDRFEVELALNIINLFDEGTSTQMYRFSVLLQDLPLSNEEFFAGFDPNQVIADEGIPRDPRAGMDSDFQNRRAVRLSLRFRF